MFSGHESSNLNVSVTLGKLLSKCLLHGNIDNTWLFYIYIYMA